MPNLLQSLAQSRTPYGLRPRGQARKSNFSRFARRWTAEEAAAFNELTKRTVDEEDWR